MFFLYPGTPHTAQPQQNPVAAYLTCSASKLKDSFTSPQYLHSHSTPRRLLLSSQPFDGAACLQSPWDAVRRHSWIPELQEGVLKKRVRKNVSSHTLQQSVPEERPDSWVPGPSGFPNQQPRHPHYNRPHGTFTGPGFHMHAGSFFPSPCHLSIDQAVPSSREPSWFPEPMENSLLGPLLP